MGLFMPINDKTKIWTLFVSLQPSNEEKWLIWSILKHNGWEEQSCNIVRASFLLVWNTLYENLKNIWIHQCWLNRSICIRYWAIVFYIGHSNTFFFLMNNCELVEMYTTISIHIRSWNLCNASVSEADEIFCPI